MRALQSLVRFIAAKDTDDERGEVREYVLANATDLAEAFGVTEAAFITGIATESDDARLGRRLVGEAKRAGRENRTARSAERARAAQASADALGRSVVWEGDRAIVDVAALLASVLTKRGDVLVCSSEGFRVLIPMSRLYDVARLRRRDLSGYVDGGGLHVRWATGGLNLRSVKPDPKASTVVVHLCARAVSAA